jgi:hypothetical protein
VYNAYGFPPPWQSTKRAKRATRRNKRSANAAWIGRHLRGGDFVRRPRSAAIDVFMRQLWLMLENIND